MMVNKLNVDVLLLMLCRLRFCKSISDNSLNLCWSLKYNFFMLHIKLIIKLDKKTNRSQFKLSRT